MTKTYTTIAGDTWDMVAYRVYGSGSMTDRLMEANRDKAETVRFAAGVTLVLPEAPGASAAATLPPWKRRAT